MKVLDCGMNGDQRFSALVAKVNIYGELLTINEHFQDKKRFMDEQGNMVKLKQDESYGKKPFAFNIGGHCLPIKYGVMFYILLWLKYLESHPELVEYLAQFDSYIDTSKVGTTLTGADVITMYFKDNSNQCYPKELRGSELKKYCLPLSRVLKDQTPLELTEKDLDNGFDYLIYSGKLFEM